MADKIFNWCSISLSGRRETSALPNARFPYWSFTKTVIAICALKLSEAGVIDLDAPLAGEAFTLRQLLMHTAGLNDYAQIAEYHRDVAANQLPWPRERLLKAVLAQGPLFTPGNGWCYSNVGYMLAREHIEAVSGKPFAHWVAEFISLPLELHSVELATTQAQFATLHWKAAAHYHPGWVYHGCLIGTASDAASILHALFCGKLVSTATREQMLMRYPLGGAIEGRPWTECGYALGLMSGRVADGVRAIGHSGAGPFCVNAVYHFPDSEDPMTVACFTEGSHEGVAEYYALNLLRR
ncbi:serine hydrolase domain-containing protein [Rouxiella badensis]|uniref:serine hydrolase domain-containing protein n=1 Tax=Rouxiella badensis TaxID=1646377 RepID=UPI0003827DE7|nr:serine hydrolase domain-containing protein [Rouxiella badensis]WAT09128.1 serine hydrolase [Rouxiella badensis]